MGPHEGQAVLFEWQWSYAAPGLLVWLTLIAAAVGLQANRNHRIWLLLIPLAIVNGVYLLFKKLSGMDSSSAAQFDVLFHSLAIGLTLLWLMGPALGRRGTTRLVIAFFLLMAVTGLAIVSYGTASSQETTIFLVSIGSLSGVSILAPAAASRLCRRFYRPVPFMLWLAVWMIVGGVVATLISFAVLLTALSSGPSVSQIPEVIFQFTIAGAILGLSLYVLHLPYMLLGFASPFFRTRLQACLSLQQPDTPEGE